MAQQSGTAPRPPRCDAKPPAPRSGRRVDGVPSREELVADPADRDALTGLANRAAFEHAMGDALRALEKAPRPASLLLVNITDLRQINADHGDRAGDAVLVQVGSLLLRAVRTHDLVGRLSGVEFAVFCPGADSRAARVIAERIQRLIEGQRFAAGGGALRVFAAVGVGTFEPQPDAHLTVSELINLADRNLQQDRNRNHDRRAAGDTVLSRR
jgi:diguanylate cyclase (GGDEF)-like protein